MPEEPIYTGDPSEQRVNVSALQTVVCHPHDSRIFVSTLLWRDPPYALAEGPMRHKFVSVWPADREAVRAHFGGLPAWPGEYMDKS
jgi:hypothetical protein